jgi:ADP-dependent NAD(P)H-hydrate dehydratase / NAD(P)H-hydrate epimerase
MYLLSAAEIRAWDQDTIENEPIDSIDLMERAAARCADWILSNVDYDLYTVICGTGNNGGDGLAIARMLSDEGRNCDVMILGDPEKGSPDFQTNYARIQDTAAYVKLIPDALGIPTVWAPQICLIDAIFGTGLNKPVEGFHAKMIDSMNVSGCPVISIDIPSGLIADDVSVPNGPVIEAEYTLTFEVPKLAFLYRESGGFVGRMHVLSIGLSPEFEPQDTKGFFLQAENFEGWMHQRSVFVHKGIYGHALLVAGSKGMGGAAVLSAKACLASGVGKLTVRVPQILLNPLQTSVPEAMTSADSHTNYHSEMTNVDRYQAIAFGPGIGRHKATIDVIDDYLKSFAGPVVIDADALNLLSEQPNWWPQLKGRTILTPHPGEFDRIFGEHATEAARLETMKKQAVEYGVVIVLKGAYTKIVGPNGRLFVNSTGNPGMATAGSGDVLTGIILALLSRGMGILEAAQLAVFAHGKAGDWCSERFSEPGCTAGGIVEELKMVWAEI